MISLNQVGCYTEKETLKIGAYLPNITPNKGYQLFADIIHAQDQFDVKVPSISVELQDKNNSGSWSYSSPMKKLSAQGHIGSEGTYLYRFRLLKNQQVIVPAFADPFARKTGCGTYSAFDYPAPPKFTWTDQKFQVPSSQDLVVYEMMVDDFAHDFAGAIQKLPYLESLGINCIELMPVTNIPEPYRWGYMPLSYFAIEERYGGAQGLKQFINACHEKKIAVIHDAVYSHMHEEFCYKKVYWEAGEDNPMIGVFAEDMFGVGPDFNKSFTRDFFLTVNQYFIEELHFDGFRYDYVPGIYDGPMGNGYARLVYETYQMTKGVTRFSGTTCNKIIQAAEYLDKPKEILQESYTTLSKRWSLMNESQWMVQNYGIVPDRFVRELLLIDFNNPWPKEYYNPSSQDQFPVAPLQFLECHDKSRLMYYLSGAHATEHGGFDLFNRDRSQWYKLQPFAIALMCAEGVPLIWQGQEFGEIYGKHDDGGSRVLAARPLHWNYFYEPNGKALVTLYRRLGSLRKTYPALRSRQSYYYYENSRLGEGLVAFLRQSPDSEGQNVLVIINFSTEARMIRLPMGKGSWMEQLEESNPESITLGQDTEVEIWVPSNFGKIFVQQ